MGRDSKYLLTGMSRCGICGANFQVIGGRSGVPDRVVTEIEAREVRVKALGAEIAGAAATAPTTWTRPTLSGP